MKTSLLVVAFIASFLIKAAAASAPAGATQGGTFNYFPSNGWNTYKVFLSPASHSGANTGCNGYVEDGLTTGAVDIAREAASGWGTDLLNRHYYVRVRWGVSVTTKVSDSNAWGADMHIAMHSNAQAQNCGAGTSYGGTSVIYQYNSQKSLAAQFKTRIGPPSPGTNDKACHTPTCSQYNSLHELTATNAKAAYLEMEYHTYQLGVDWLLSRTWQWRIGWAVDKYWGYPRNLIY